MNTWKEIMLVMGVVLVLISAASLPDIRVGQGISAPAPEPAVVVHEHPPAYASSARKAPRTATNSRTTSVYVDPTGTSR